MEKLNQFFEKFFATMQAQPHIAGLFISGLGLIMLIAVIMDADWMLQGGNGFFNIASISKYFGRKTARILMGLLSLILLLSGLAFYFIYRS